MENILVLSQIIISISILIVWVFRFDNIVIEFEQYGLSSLLRNVVGASKISLATILVIGIWHNEYLFFASITMAFLMLCAQFFHFRAKNNWIKFIPSLSLLILSLFIAYSYYNYQCMSISFYLIVFSSISFIYYGINSLFSKRMHSEYSRWGYKNLRIFLACCQLLGGCGLIIGMTHHSLNPLISVTSFLLTVMMLTAVFTRIKSKDGLLLTLPSLFYSILNIIIFFQSIS